MSILERAKEHERSCSNATHLTIRLALLQDLIAEIERLQQGGAAKRKVASLDEIRAAAQQREEG